MSNPKYREIILETIDSLRKRKARPDLDRISHMVERKHGVSNSEVARELNLLVQQEIVLEVQYKGSTSYRNAAKWKRTQLGAFPGKGDKIRRYVGQGIRTIMEAKRQAATVRGALQQTAAQTKQLHTSSSQSSSSSSMAAGSGAAAAGSQGGGGGGGVSSLKGDGEEEEEARNSQDNAGGAVSEKKATGTSLAGGGGVGGYISRASAASQILAASAGMASEGIEIPASVDAVLEEDEIGASADELEHFLMLKDLGSPLTKNKLKLILAREMEYERILKLQNGNYVQNPNAPVKKRLKDRTDESPQKMENFSPTTPEPSMFRTFPSLNNNFNNANNNNPRMISVPATATIIPAVKNADGMSSASNAKPALPPNHNNNGGNFVAVTHSSQMTPSMVLGAPSPALDLNSARGPIVTYEKTRTSATSYKPVTASDLSTCVVTVPVALNRVGGIATAHGLAVNLAGQTPLQRSASLSSVSSTSSIPSSMATIAGLPNATVSHTTPIGFGTKRPSSLDVAEASTSSAEMAKRAKTDPSQLLQHPYTSIPANAYVHATAAGIVAAAASPATPPISSARFIGHPIPLSIPFSFANSMTSNMSPTTVIIASPQTPATPASPMAMREAVLAGSNAAPINSPLKCDYCLMFSAVNKEGEQEMLLTCKDCGARAHPSCMDFSRELALKAREGPWQCIDCKTCSKCRDPGLADPLLVCEACDKAYHTCCHFPPIPQKPVGKWVCHGCVMNLNASLISRAEDGEEEEVEVGEEDIGGGGKSEAAASSAASDADSCFGWIDGEGRFVAPSTSGNQVTFNPDNLHLQYPPGNDLGPVHPTTYVQAQWSIFKSYQEFLDVPPAKLEETPDARSWGPEEMFQYLRTQGFADDDARVFVDQDIDGRAALLLKRQDVISSLGLKLGPAIKLFRQIQVLQLKYKEIEAI